jgi:hypothetical protein
MIRTDRAGRKLITRVEKRGVKLIKLTELYPGGWDEIAQKIQTHRDGLWGTQPDVPAVDLSGLVPPRELLETIREKNGKRVRDEITAAELTAQAELFDEQLVEVIDSIESKYEAEDFIAQLVWLVHMFWSESAALRGGHIEERLGKSNADGVVGLVKHAFDSATSTEEKLLLDLLIMDMTNGGDSDWIAHLGPEPRNFVDDVLARQNA